jgi:hypothetical protein
VEIPAYMLFNAGIPGMKLKSLLGDLQVDRDLRVTNYKALGLKSPKLTKALEARGFGSQFVSLLVQALKKQKLELTSSKDDVIAQSDSEHFTSCQAPGHEMNVAHQDVEAASLGHLYLAVVRTPKGFSYRTKIRRCLNPETGATCGWHVDREYGQGRPTSYQFSELLKKAGEPAFDVLSYYDSTRYGQSERLEAQVEIPSAALGYQDTFKSGCSEALIFEKVGEEPAVEDFELPIRRNPSRRHGLLVEALLEVLFEPKQEHQTRSPEVWAIRRILKKIRRENPHYSWIYQRRKKLRHDVHVYWVYERQCWCASSYCYEPKRMVEIELKFSYNPDERKWSFDSACVSNMQEPPVIAGAGDDDIPPEEPA